MSTFRGTITKLRLSKKVYYVTLKERVTALVQDAAVEFVEAASQRVPVYSGQARSIFVPLANFLNKETGQLKFRIHEGIVIPVDPVIAPSEFRAPSIGEEAGRGAYKFSYDSDRLVFSFKPDLSAFTGRIGDAFKNYYNFFDNNADPTNAKHPEVEPPWHSFQSGADAFHNYVQANASRYFKRFKMPLIRTTIGIHDGNSSTTEDSADEIPF